MMVNEKLETHELLYEEGYRLKDDAWSTYGRRTYLHDDDASKHQLTTLRRALAPSGWTPHPTILRAFTNASGELIELEPGGSETSGHFLHHLKAGWEE